MRRGENRSSRSKTSRSRVENQQTQPTYDAGSGNRTRDTLVEGERSHHYTNPAPLPPFLNNETFTESEARATKAIIKCRIHVKRANARLKDMKLYSFIFMLSCRHNISAVCITWQFAVPSDPKMNLINELNIYN